MHNKTALFSLLALIFTLAWVSGTASATCPDGDGGNNLINCSADDTDGVATGVGNDTVNLNGHTISNNGDGVNAGGNVTVNGVGTISTTGDGANGIMNANGDITNSGDISTTGNLAHGIAANGDVTNSGDISTAGGAAYGITALGNVTNTGDISTTGSNARGIFAVGNLTNTGDISSTLSGGILGSGNAQTITISSGTVTGGGGTAIDVGGGNDTVTINTASTINGTINGGAQTDTLEFTGNLTVTTAEQTAIIAYLVDANAASGNITLGGKNYVWINFEVLGHTLVFTVVDPDTGVAGTVALSTDAPPSTNEITCGGAKVFRTPDGFVQVYAGFDLLPNGFMVAVFGVDVLVTGGTFALDDPNTPNWSVRVSPVNLIEVLNEGGAVVAGCRL